MESRHTDALAAYAAAYRYDLLPQDAIEAAKLILLDTIGTTLAGSLPRYAASRLTGDLARNLGGKPECTVIGRGFKADLASAALANGVMGYAADAEGGGVCSQHAAAVLVPVALTVGEREHANGRTLIAALSLGYDVAARIDRAANKPGAHYPHSFHPSAVFGHFGAAATAGHVLRLDRRQFVNALGLAGINAGGLITWVNDPTEDSRPYVIGMAAHCGVLAAVLAQMGMGGPLGIADDNKYTIYDAFSGAMNLEEVTRDLGQVFWITRHHGFKTYPCCGDIHTGLDALLKIIGEHDLQPDDIEGITHRVHPGRAKVIDNNPLKSHCAQYIMAVAAVYRDIAPDVIVTDYRDTDPRVRDLSRRTQLVADPGAAELGYGSAIVEVRARDGRTLREAVAVRRGDARNPLSRQEIDEKFFRLATSRIRRERAERVFALVDDLERLDDTARLVELLSVPEDEAPRP